MNKHERPLKYKKNVCAWKGAPVETDAIDLHIDIAKVYYNVHKYIVCVLFKTKEDLNLYRLFWTFLRE